jgi:hypothetical protein
LVSGEIHRGVKARRRSWGAFATCQSCVRGSENARSSLGEWEPCPTSAVHRQRSQHFQHPRSAFQRSASGGCPEQPGVSAASRPRTPAQNASVCGFVQANQSEPRSAPTEPQAQRFPAERVGWVPGATRCIGGFPPAHSGPKRLRLRLCSRQSADIADRPAPSEPRSAPNRANHIRLLLYIDKEVNIFNTLAALSSGARRM